MPYWRKITPLKSRQGVVWKTGCESGELQRLPATLTRSFWRSLH